MNGHIIDELPQLLTGEADRATVADVARHLRECSDCCDELISAVAAHAALTSAAHYAPDLVVADRSDDAARPIDVATIAAPTPIAPNDPPPSLPDLSVVFAQIRTEVEVERSPSTSLVAAPPTIPDSGIHRARRSQQRRTWLVAAALVVAVGAGTGGYVAANSSSGPTSQALALQAFGDGTQPASARLIGSDRMDLDASTLPQLPGGSYYEVWLTNRERTSMAPVGVLSADGKASLRVPASEMSTYAAVEVSVQKTSGVGSYSGHSVLRGTYA
jgi:hypothetical protein